MSCLTVRERLEDETSTPRLALRQYNLDTPPPIQRAVTYACFTCIVVWFECLCTISDGLLSNIECFSQRVGPFRVVELCSLGVPC